MKLKAIILTLIVYLCGYLHAMELDDYELTEFCSVLIQQEHNFSGYNDEQLKKEINAIACVSARSLNKLVSKYSDLIFFASKESPSLLVTFEGTTNENCNGLKWRNQSKYNQYSGVAIAQSKAFITRFKQIVWNTQIKLENLKTLCPANLEHDSFITLKIQLRFQAFEEDAECVSTKQLLSCCNYLGTLYNAYRW